MIPRLSLSGRVFSFLAALPLIFAPSARAEGPDPPSPSLPDSVADSVTLSDTVSRRPAFPFSGLDSLSRGAGRETQIGGNSCDAGLHDLALSYPVNLADMLYPAPGMTAGDSLGNGYPVGFSYLGTGFDQVRPTLNGMPLVDPLTGTFDYRSISPDILRNIRLSPGAVGSGPYGGAAALELSSHFSTPGLTISRMGISGGSFEINRMGGGLRRGLFGRGALQVDINKVQQSAEDFHADFENVQFYSRLEQGLGESALFSVDGLYFSDTRKSSGFSTRRKNDDTHIQAALSGRLGDNTDYRLALRHSASWNFFSVDTTRLNVQARSRGYAAFVERRFDGGMRLGFQAEGARDRALNYAFSPGAAWNHFVGLRGGFSFHGGIELGFVSGFRPSSHARNMPVFDLSLYRAARQGGVGFYSSIQREALTPSLLTLARLDSEARETGIRHGAGRMTRVEGGLELVPREGIRLRGGPVYLKVSKHPFAGPEPVLFHNSIPVHRVDYGVGGISYSLDSPVFRRISLAVRGLQLFETPSDVPWLPGASHSATLSTGGELFNRDMGFTIRAGIRYAGEMRFFPAGAPETLTVQPSRLDFNGTATLRIVDLVIYGRLDHLLGTYYNRTDPLQSPGPRAVIGVNWLFRD